MKKLSLIVAALLATALPEGALAQTATVTKQPQFVANQSWVDLGNGPTEVLLLEGNGNVYTALGSGTGGNGGASGTAIALTAAPAVPPCVGCVISGPGITPGTTVALFTAPTAITLSAAMAVPNGSALAWGAACPTSGQPSATAGLSAPIAMRAAAGAGDTALPLFTTARVCAYGALQTGATVLNFAIGAW